MKRQFSPVGVMLAGALFAFGAAPVFSQERPSPSGHGSGEHAVPRGSGGGGSSAPAPSGGSSSSSSSGGSSTGTSSGGGDHAVSRAGGREGGRERAGGGAMRGEPRSRSVILPSGGRSGSDSGDRSAPASYPAGGAYARPRGDRPTSGRAVPRGDITNVPIPQNWNNDYWNYWYYSYYSPYYRYGYSPCMPYYYGCFYYDPFWWDYYYGYTPGYYGYGSAGGGYATSDSDFDTGALKLKVKPRDAQVYVDGYFSGVVDDFDGVFQKLRLPAGAHRIELRAEGYEPSTFDALIVAGETVTYRADLKPRK